MSGLSRYYRHLLLVNNKQLNSKLSPTLTSSVTTQRMYVCLTVCKVCDVKSDIRRFIWLGHSKTYNTVKC